MGKREVTHILANLWQTRQLSPALESIIGLYRKGGKPGATVDEDPQVVAEGFWLNTYFYGSSLLPEHIVVGVTLRWNVGVQSCYHGNSCTMGHYMVVPPVRRIEELKRKYHYLVFALPLTYPYRTHSNQGQTLNPTYHHSTSRY